MSEKVELSELKSFEVSKDTKFYALDGIERPYQIEKIGEYRFLMLMEHQSHLIEVVEAFENQVTLKVNGKETTATYKSQISQMLESLGMSTQSAEKINELKAPMPGSILDVLCKPGDEVKKGDPLLILEAMKMENVIKSSGEGVVDVVHIIKGQNVDKNHVLISFK